MSHTLLLSGPSGSGKSSLARLLQQDLSAQGCDVTLIQQDDFFATPRAPSYWSQDGSKETAAAVDMAALRSAVSRAQQRAAGSSRSIILVEGFMLLQDHALIALTSAVLFLIASESICLRRRIDRSSRTAHEDEGCREYYARHVWPSFMTITRPAASRLLAARHATDATPIAILEASATIDAVESKALVELPALLPGLAGVARRAANLLVLRDALHTSDWAQLTTLLPAVLESSQESARRRWLGAGVATSAAGLLRRAAAEAYPPPAAATVPLTALFRLLRNCVAETAEVRNPNPNPLTPPSTLSPTKTLIFLLSNSPARCQ